MIFPPSRYWLCKRDSLIHLFRDRTTVAGTSDAAPLHNAGNGLLIYRLCAT